MKAQAPQWTPGTGVLYTAPSTTKVGIGTATPQALFEVYNPGLSTNAILSSDANKQGALFLGDFNTAIYRPASTTNLTLYNSGDRLTIQNNGNVGIGTTSPQYKLSVNGTIGTKEVIVTNAGWADYVFQPGYRLKPLSEVEQHIRERRRLPEMPSEAEVKANGIGLGEMQVKLLAKIEELTLHLIQLDERNRQLQRDVIDLKARLGR